MSTAEEIRSNGRLLRVFISHRWREEDQDLYKTVLAELRKNFGEVQDLSLPEDRRISGPRGGRVAKAAIAQEVSARIFSSDVVLAPSRVGISYSPWIQWEVEVAAYCYSVPVVFIDHDREQKYASQLVEDLKKSGADVRRCYRDANTIAMEISRLFRADHFARTPSIHAEGGHLYRGPRPKALDHIMFLTPFVPKTRDARS